MLFHLITNDKGDYEFSAVPTVDRLHGDWTRYISIGLPLLLLHRALSVRSRFSFWGSWKKENHPEESVLRNIKRVMAQEGIAVNLQPTWQDISKSNSLTDNILILQQDKVFEKFLKSVEGRQLAENELWLLGNKLGIKEKDLLVIMQYAVCQKIAEWVPVFNEKKEKCVCQRCGSSDYVEWPSIYGKTYTCKECKSIGPVNSLEILFRLRQTDSDSDSDGIPAGEGKYSTHRMHECQTLSLTYSNAQRQAADELWQHVLREKKKETLLWAACGAGKTEVCFPLIQYFLQKKKKVLFAAPRQDVVHDVLPRLQRCFPDAEIKILSGAVQEDFRPSQLIIATTHQVLRFYRAFDVIIFDEIDAYPYAGNQMLAYGMKHALKVSGQMIYLTATPSEEILERVSANQCPVVKLPIRYHGLPLPVPEWHKNDLKATYSINQPSTYMNRMVMDKSLLDLKEVLKELTFCGPVLVFVPTVALVKVWKHLLAYIFSDLNVEGSWSSDPDRRNKVTAFCKGKGDIFVCTSILERGVTINGVQTVILYANDEIFNTRTLVQMSGRTGRTPDSSGGRVLFLAAKESTSMVKAKRWIIEQNNLAKTWVDSHE